MIHLARQLKGGEKVNSVHTQVLEVKFLSLINIPKASGKKKKKKKAAELKHNLS